MKINNVIVDPRLKSREFLGYAPVLPFPQFSCNLVSPAVFTRSNSESENRENPASGSPVSTGC
jgi:hypothetical protein